MDAFASIHSVPATWLHNSALAPFVPSYWRYLLEQHYAAQTARVYLCCVAHFARWMRRCRLAVCDLSEDEVQRFVDEHLPRCTCPSPVQRCRHQVRAALRCLLTLLEDVGAIARSHASNPVEDELRRLDEHMQRARGLAENTRAQRLRILRPFFQQICAANQASRHSRFRHPMICAGSSTCSFIDGTRIAQGFLLARCAATSATERSAVTRWGTCCPSSRHPLTGAWHRCRELCRAWRSRCCSMRSRQGCRRGFVPMQWSAASSIWVCAHVRWSASAWTTSTGRLEPCASSRTSLAGLTCSPCHRPPAEPS